MKKYSIRDILNRFKWHPEYDFSEVSVIFIDRPKGFSEIKGDDIEEIGYKFIYLSSGVAVPHHRIVKIIYGGKVVWER
jgi:hypothetical protein